MAPEIADTPAMRQYRRFKELHPDCVLFFRMGDFYEMFYDDARLAHRVLGVTLTQRTQGIPMAGVPYHSVENYLRRMIQAGHRVAVCEQVEDPKMAKGVVRRDVTRVITPGTLTDESLLEDHRENPLAAVMFHGAGGGEEAAKRADITPAKTPQTASLAWAELSTGSFWLTTLPVDALGDELARISPRELLYVETANRQPPPRVAQLLIGAGFSATARPAWQFRPQEAFETLCRQFGVKGLAGFGLADDDPALGVAAAIVSYLVETQCAQTDRESLPTTNSGASATSPTLPRQPTSLAHLQPPRRFQRHDHLIIDQTSLRSLEIEQTIRGNASEGTLLGVLLSGGDCRTSMGKRMLRQWLCYPLCQLEPIMARQRVVGALIEDTRLLDALRLLLDEIQDVERIAARVSVGRALPRDVVAMGRSCDQAQKLAALLADRPAMAGYHQQLADVADPLAELGQTLLAACVDEPPSHLRDGGLFRDGFDEQLDEYRGLQRDSQTWLSQYQQSLIQSTGIANLKVGFNRVFGYYIELTAAQRDRAPADWTRKQTLKNAERFITQALKEYEVKVLSAGERAKAREQELFAALCQRVCEHTAALRTLAHTAATMDVLACFARRAVRCRYVKPQMVSEPVLNIEAGRHPVLDVILGDQFVPNDLQLGTTGNSDSDGASAAQSPATLALITGPNMAGKSTFIRQAALITLLAHTGSYVPATAATVGLCDRIFTRIGASDELHAGASTFMVEMTETANICHYATDRSLVILDEIGRGTSTLDGLSLAWSIAEHLAQRRPRTLFATHYHEVTQLAQACDNVTNLHVTVREWADQIVFLHRVLPGSTDRSYGIHVARIAGLPGNVVSRANELLSQLSVNYDISTSSSQVAKAAAHVEANQQMSLFTQYLEHPSLEQIRAVDLDALTPMAAFDLLRQVKRDMR